MEKAGFVEIEEIDEFEEFGVRKGSFANLPFGKISLNVKAYKETKIDSSLSAVFKEDLFEKVIFTLESLFFLLSRAMIEIRMRMIRRRLRKNQ